MNHVHLAYLYQLQIIQLNFFYYHIIALYNFAVSGNYEFVLQGAALVRSPTGEDFLHL